MIYRTLEGGFVISIIYLSKRNMARLLFVVVILGAIIGIFHSSLRNAAEEVVSVLVANTKLHPIYAVDTKEKKVAISFDATWGSTRTPQLLDILDQYKIKTTFFLTNIWMNEYPQLTKEIADRGHEIALHTANHPNLTELGEAQIQKELQDNAGKVTELTGQRAILFRPPYGAYNNLVIKTIQGLNLIPIQWSVDSLDWKNLSAEEMYQRVTKRIHPGAIVLFHNDGAYTPKALPGILDYLKGEGYVIVPVSELLYKDNYYVDVNGIQKLK